MTDAGSVDPHGARLDRVRTHAVNLYCRELCGSERMADAAAEAVASISPADAWGGDEQLLRLTRVAAARHAPRRSDAPGEHDGAAHERARDCLVTPSLLARRANGELAPAQQSRLEEHLARCLFCAGLGLRERRAARAFRAVIATGDPATQRADRDEEKPETEPVAGDDLSGTTEFAIVEPPVEEEPPEALAEDDEWVEAEDAEPPREAEEPLAPSPGGRRGFVVFPASGRQAGWASATAPRAAPRPASSQRPTLSGSADTSPSFALREFVPFLATLAAGIVVVLVVAVLVGSGGGQSSAASLPPPSAASTPPASVGINATLGARARPKAGRTLPQTPAAGTTTTAP